MKKIMIIVNFVAFIFLFSIIAEIKLPIITGYATVTSPTTISTQPHIILALVVLLAALALNTYFFTRGKNSLIKVKK